MKRILKTLWLIMALFACFSLAAQGVVKGKVVDKVSNQALEGIVVNVGISVGLTDKDGYFEIGNLPNGKTELSISEPAYRLYTQKLRINEQVIQLEIALQPSAREESGSYSELSLSEFDIEGEEGKGQAVSGLLTGRDVFENTAGYTLGFAYFRSRGLDNEYNSVYINQMDMNDAENGRASYSEWGGLNDAMRSKQTDIGIAPSEYSFGNLAGAANINARASAIPKQHKFSYSASNRTYTHRLMYTYGSGILSNGWSFAASVSARLGKTGYIPGTPYEGYGYFLAAEKRFGTSHAINFTVFGSPTKRGQQGGSVQEIYDLLGTHYYNPNWGYHKGEVRTARMRHSHLPTFILTHDFNPNEKTKLTTTFAYQFGKFGTTALNWYDAPDPRPDYYRYLPSYQIEQNIKDMVAQEWRRNPSKSQINWDKLYQVNYAQNASGGQAKYILEDRRNDAQQIDISSVLNRDLNKNLKLNGGISYKWNRTHNYKTIYDLLGGEYWVDIDQFSERDFPGNPDIIQNDLNDPNRVVKEGDIYGYNYYTHVHKESVWANLQMNFAHIDAYIGAMLSGTQFYREGMMKNGRAPEHSYGKGSLHDFLNYSLKGGITYKITGQHYIYANLLWETRAPFARDAYISPRVKDQVAANLESAKIFSADLSYAIRTSFIKGRITAFHTMIFDDLESTAFYHDEYRTFVNYTRTGVNRIHQGIELGLEFKILPSLSATLAGCLGNYRYTSRPTSTVSFENGSRPDVSYLVYQKNFYVSGTPQNAGSIGIKYQAPFRIYLNANFNYFGKMYLSFNPERRTELALEGLLPDDPRLEKILHQEKLPNQGTIDLSIGKSFSFDYKYYLNINLSVSNILNNKNLITGGYEQNRFDFTDKNVDKFPPRYFYAMGTTVFLNIGFRF